MWGDIIIFMFFNMILPKGPEGTVEVILNYYKCTNVVFNRRKWLNLTKKQVYHINWKRY